MAPFTFALLAQPSVKYWGQSHDGDRHRLHLYELLRYRQGPPGPGSAAVDGPTPKTAQAAYRSIGSGKFWSRGDLRRLAAGSVGRERRRRQWREYCWHVASCSKFNDAGLVFNSRLDRLASCPC